MNPPRTMYTVNGVIGTNGVNGAKPSNFDADIIVVGGPVGTFVTLRLARAGIKVLLFEADPQRNSAPRAAVYTGPSVFELQRAGILEDVRALGLQNSDVCWRKVNGEIIAGLDRGIVPQDPLNPVTLDQFRLETVILKHLDKYPDAKVLWNHKVIAMENSAEFATVTCETAEGPKKYTSGYVIGADGGKSTVRKLIGVEFEGFTWPFTVVATNVYYPFRENGFWSAQFIVDPEHWALLCHLDSTGLWRVSYGEKEGLTTEEYMERLPAKFEALFPGPKPVKGKWELKSMSPYRIHQRCADTFRKGRVVLAGDAAHLCNPFGGLGLTGGMLDAGCLADAFEGIYNEGQPDSILTKYSEIRRKIFQEYTDPWSQANVKRLYSLDPDTAIEDPFIQAVANASSSEESRQAFLQRPQALRVDIRDYFVK